MIAVDSSPDMLYEAAGRSATPRTARSSGRVQRDYRTVADTSTRCYSRVAVVLSLGLFGHLGGGVLCDVHCEAELADNADVALAAAVVASAEPSFWAHPRIGVRTGCSRSRAILRATHVERMPAMSSTLLVSGALFRHHPTERPEAGRNGTSGSPVAAPTDGHVSSVWSRPRGM